ncbi:hypothetical protein RCL1_007658 [Eukaryota sp. TZLM3-RCL]
MEEGLEPLEKVADYTANYMALKKRIKIEVTESFLVVKFLEGIYPQEVKRAISLRVHAGLLSTVTEVAKDVMEEIERFYVYRPRPKPYQTDRRAPIPQSEDWQPINNDENRILFSLYA